MLEKQDSSSTQPETTPAPTETSAKSISACAGRYTASNNSSAKISKEQIMPSSHSLPLAKRTNAARKPTAEPIPGLLVFEDFITPEEEEQILAAMDDFQKRDDYLPWKQSAFNGNHLGKRWGVHCNLRTRQVTPAEHPLPRFMHDIMIPKLQALHLPAMERVQWVPNEANAIDYRRKQGHMLKNHVDDRKMSKEPIVNLSLAGDCYMTFINEKMMIANNNNDRNHNRHSTEEEIIREKRVLLKRRCLQVLTGKARYDYSHGIRHSDLLTDRRVSLTMRESPLTTTTNNSSYAKSANQPTLENIFSKKRKASA